MNNSSFRPPSDDFPEDPEDSGSYRKQRKILRKTMKDSDKAVCSPPKSNFEVGLECFVWGFIAGIGVLLLAILLH